MLTFLSSWHLIFCYQLLLVENLHHAREQGSVGDIVNWANLPGQRPGQKRELERKITVKDNQHDVSTDAFFFSFHVIIIISIYSLSIQELEL